MGLGSSLSDALRPPGETPQVELKLLQNHP